MVYEAEYAVITNINMSGNSELQDIPHTKKHLLLL